MKKILFSLLLIFTVFNFLVLRVDAAITSDQIDGNSTNIILPSEFNSGVETTISLNGIEGGIGYYQIINVTNNQELLSAYNDAQADTTKVDALVTAMNSDSNIMDPTNWEQIPEGGKITPEYQYGEGDIIMLVVKYESATTTKYNLKTSKIEVKNNTTNSTNKPAVENKDTGIEDWYLVLVPIAIIGGAYLVTRRHRYE